MNYSIEFTGGTLMQLKFAAAPGADAVARRGRSGRDSTAPRSSSSARRREYTVQAQVVAGAGRGKRRQRRARRSSARSSSALGADEQRRDPRTESVGARVGEELQDESASSRILISFAVTLIYLAFRFEWRFGVAAVVATAHDILATLAFLSMMHLEVSLTVVAALLTVIGYSLNDTIIIFDRVRENLRKARKESLYDVLNRSINETLPRSILTHATTLAATLALLFFAGEVIRPFSWIMAFGIFTGTFSSIYVAGALLLWIENKWPRDTGETKGTSRALAEGRRRERSDAAPVGLADAEPRVSANRRRSC